MKKLLLVLLVLVLSTGGAFAQIVAGGGVGVQYTLNSEKDAYDALGDVSYIGFPIQLFALYQLKDVTFEIEDFGMAEVAVGLTTGYLSNVLSIKDGMTIGYIPVLAMGRLSLDWLYIDLAAGLFMATDENINDIGMGGYAELGYMHALSEKIGVTAGFRSSGITQTIGNQSHIFTGFGINLGAAYAF
ncbi:hypothetical protein [Spirochaeta dissipatitropha]